MFALAAFAVLLAIVLQIVEPTPIGGLPDAAQKQDAESGLYFAAFGLILPVSLVAASLVADAVARGPNSAGLSFLVALLASLLLLAIIATRLSAEIPRGGGIAALLAAVGVWWLGAGWVLARAARGPAWRPLLSLAGHAQVVWATAGALLVCALLTVTDLNSMSLIPLAIAAAAIPAAVYLLHRRRSLAIPRGWGIAADVLIIVLLFLAVPDLGFIAPDNPDATVLDRFREGVVQFHQDLLLGPANQMMAGAPMLVDTAAQYGVGSIYFLVGWFELVPIGYGSFSLLNGMLTALFFVAGYCVLRVAGVTRLLAASAFVVAVAALLVNAIYPVGALGQEGPLRFGLPLAVVLAQVVGARYPGRGRLADIATLGVLGVASIWALEAFAFTAATFAAIAFFRASLLAPGTRLRWLGRGAAAALGVCVGAHVLFAMATLVGAGELPDWGMYLAFLRAFIGDLGDLTYDFALWSPGLAVGGVYLASAAGVLLLMHRQRAFVRSHHVVLLAITGVSAYGIVFFSYFVDRSGSHVLPFVSLPAVLAATLWLSLVLRPEVVPRFGTRATALAVTASVAALLLAVAWSSLGRLDRSALAHVVPGGDGIGDAVDRLVDFPPIDRRTPAAERLLERYMPDERRSLVFLRPGPTNEALYHSGRAHRLPLSNPYEDDFIRAESVPRLRAGLATLAPGERVLVDAAALATLAKLRREPGADPFEQGLGGIAPLQAFLLSELQERFRMRPVHRDADGLAVLELERRG